jgi:hypothetical protein
MPFTRNHVRAFLARTEIDLFESSLGAELKALSAADVQRRVERTRKLRDKYHDLLRRQKLATRARTGSKTGSSGEDNERTAKKAKAFDETLARFETQAKHLAAAAKKAAAKSPAKSARTAKTAAKPPARLPRLVPAAVMLREVLEKKRAAEALALASRPKRSHKAPALPPTAPIGGVGATPPDVRAAAVASRLDQSGMARIQGHTGSKVRIAQAKRDQRG